MPTDRAPIDPEGIIRDTKNVVSKIRSMASELWAFEEHEQDLLAGNNDRAAYAKPADPSKT
jgi:hypothetical protein